MQYDTLSFQLLVKCTFWTRCVFAAGTMQAALATFVDIWQQDEVTIVTILGSQSRAVPTQIFALLSGSGASTVVKGT